MDVKTALALYNRLSSAIDQELVASCHDCSDGGLGAALAESAFAGGYGLDVDITPLGLRDDRVALFSESQSRFVVTVAPDRAAAFETTMAESVCIRLGRVIEDNVFRLVGREGARIEAPLAELKEAWQRPLRW